MDSTNLLQAANTGFEAFLDRHVRTADGSRDYWILPEEIREIRHWLNEVRRHISKSSVAHDEAAAPELRRYIHNLEKLQPILRNAQEWMMAKRTALDEHQQQMHRVVAWAVACKSTF